jgi:lactate dehydrogenase-like 2-hydroxyacid dehydrogenase
MHIVILDGLTTNPGDVSWEPLERLGTLTVFDRTPPGEVAARAAGAAAVLTNKAIVGREQIAALPDLRYIGVLATGTNIVDLAAASERGIPVCNVPEYSTPNVVQATWALILELANRVGHHDRTVHEGRWAASHDFCYWDAGHRGPRADRPRGGRGGAGPRHAGDPSPAAVRRRPGLRGPRHALSRERCRKPPLPAHAGDEGVGG